MSGLTPHDPETCDCCRPCPPGKLYGAAGPPPLIGTCCETGQKVVAFWRGPDLVSGCEVHDTHHVVEECSK